jgi:hypothetical protein
MFRSKLRRAAPVLVLCAALAGVQAGESGKGSAVSKHGAGKGLTQGQFESLRKVTRPTAAEGQWASLPWEIDTLEAFRKAAKEGKPIFMYSRYAGVPCGAG